MVFMSLTFGLLFGGRVNALKDESLDPSEAATISEAREAYRNNTFDAIILDVMLPDGKNAL